MWIAHPITGVVRVLKVLPETEHTVLMWTSVIWLILARSKLLVTTLFLDSDVVPAL